MVAKKRTARKPTKRVSKRRAPQKRVRRATVVDAKTEAQRISSYLRALAAKKTAKGPKADPKVLARRIEAARATVHASTGITQLTAVQNLRNLEKRANNPVMNGTFDALETGFIQVAKSYSDRRGIEYGAWRAVGVDAGVLKKAGISRAK